MKNKNQLGFALAHLLPVVVAVLAVGGVSAYVVMKQHQKTNNSESSVSKEATLAAPLPTDLLTVDKVKELATAQKPASNVLAVQLENEEGILLYKVKLGDGTILVFNARTGAVVTGTAKGEFEGQANLPADLKAAIAISKAKDIAQAQKAGSTVKKIELELEDGILVYSVRFTDGSRVDVNANDGTVVRAKAGSKPEVNKASPSSSKTEDKPSSTNKSNSGSNKTVNQSPSSSSSNSGSSNHDTTPETETHNSITPEDSSHHGGSSGNSGRGSDH
jgi:uncharacterized membrane protein YkoI